MKGKLGIVGVVVALLVTATVVWAAYTGPIRPRTVQVTTGWVRTIYRNNPWQRECQCGMSGPGERCGDNDYGCFCGDAPYNNGSLYTCYEDAVTRSVTHNPATASGNFTCGTPGTNGWCRGGASLNVSGSEPVSGYSIQRIEGNYDNSNNAAVSCSGASCGFTPPQGQGTFWYWAVSSYGDTSAKGSMAYKVDTVPPSVSLSPSGTWGNSGWYISPVEVGASATDATSGVANLALSCGSNPCTVSAEGTTTISANAVDAAGNTASQNLTVQVDTIPPLPSITLSGTAGSNGWYTSPVNAVADGSDATSGVSSAEVQLDGGGWESTAQVGEGVHTLTFRAVDVAGNASGEQRQVVRVDTTPPQTSLAVNGQAGQNGWYISPVEVAVQAEDATSGVDQVVLDVNGAATNDTQATLEDGVYQLSAYSVDVAGWASEIAAVAVQVDTTPPQAAFGDFPARLSRTVELTGSAADGTSGLQTVELSLDGGRTWEALTVVNGEWSTTWDTTTTQGGDHTLLLRAVDAAGNTTMTSRTVRVANRGPSAWVTSSWPVWESGQVDVNAGDLPVKSVCITIRDPQNRWPEVENCYDSLSDVPREVKWDRRFADGTRAPAGSYLVRVEITDILGQSDVAQGEIVVPLLALALPQPSATPTPTATPTSTSTEAIRLATPMATPTREAPASSPTVSATPTCTPVRIAATPAAAVSRPLWPFLTLIGLAVALGYSAMRDERPQAIRKLAERMAEITRMEVK